MADMMGSVKADTSLVERLERLSDRAECDCVPAYRSLARSIRSSRDFSKALQRAKALSDENRLLALTLIQRRGELCACEIQAATGLSHPTVSHHMSVLCDAGLATSRREGKWLYYRANDGE